MKAWMVFLLGISISASTMARFNVFQVRVNMKVPEVQEDKGKGNINGDKFTFDYLAKRPCNVKGLLLYDDWTGEASFIYLVKQDCYQTFAQLWCYHEDDCNFRVRDMEGYLYNYAARGLITTRLYIDLGFLDKEIWLALCGNWSYTERELANGNFVDRFVVNAGGAGDGYEDELDRCFPVKNARMRLDNRKSDWLYDAFVVAGGYTNETAGLDAVDAALNEMLKKEAELFWPRD